MHTYRLCMAPTQLSEQHFQLQLGIGNLVQTCLFLIQALSCKSGERLWMLLWLAARWIGVLVLVSSGGEHCTLWDTRCVGS